MKKILTVPFLFLCFIQAWPENSQAQERAPWKLVYENDENGNPLRGDLSELIADIRNGLEVRLGWQSPRRGDDPRWVEHVAEASFITILSGEIVFAQIHGILGQTPDFTKEEVLLKENLSWTLLAASNGKSDAIMRDMATSEIKGHTQRRRGFKWWVRK